MINPNDFVLTLAHIDGRDVITFYDPGNPDTLYDGLGWHTDFHVNPIAAAVICMRVWTVLDQTTLFDKYEQCGAGVSVTKQAKNTLDISAPS